MAIVSNELMQMMEVSRPYKSQVGFGSSYCGTQQISLGKWFSLQKTRFVFKYLMKSTNIVRQQFLSPVCVLMSPGCPPLLPGT